MGATPLAMESWAKPGATPLAKVGWAGLGATLSPRNGAWYMAGTTEPRLRLLLIAILYCSWGPLPSMSRELWQEENRPLSLSEPQWTLRVRRLQAELWRRMGRSPGAGGGCGDRSATTSRHPPPSMPSLSPSLWAFWAASFERRASSGSTSSRVPSQDASTRSTRVRLATDTVERLREL